MLFNLSKKKTESANLARLRALSLFANLKPSELAIINNLLHERVYVKDEIVFDEGEEGQAIYFIFSGSVLICRQGRPVEGMIAELHSGQFFGELALLDNSPRAAQVRTAEDCTLAALFREDFMGLLETNAAIASKISLQLSRHIGHRLRDAIHRYVI